jgi:hypothetical protein
MQNEQYYIYITLCACLLLWLINNNCIYDTEGYQSTRLPFDTEGIVYPMKLDLFYERYKDDTHRSLIESKGIDYVAPPSNVCADSIIKHNSEINHNMKYKDSRIIHTTSLKNHENNTRVTKLHLIKIAKLENENIFLKDTLRNYKQKIAFYRRELTFEPTPNIRPNSITGVGVETQFLSR